MVPLVSLLNRNTGLTGISTDHPWVLYVIAVFRCNDHADDMLWRSSSATITRTTCYDDKHSTDIPELEPDTRSWCVLPAFPSKTTSARKSDPLTRPVTRPSYTSRDRGIEIGILYVPSTVCEASHLKTSTPHPTTGFGRNENAARLTIPRSTVGIQSAHRAGDTASHFRQKHSAH